MCENWSEAGAETVGWSRMEQSWWALDWGCCSLSWTRCWAVQGQLCVSFVSSAQTGQALRRGGDTRHHMNIIGGTGGRERYVIMISYLVEHTIQSDSLLVAAGCEMTASKKRWFIFFFLQFGKINKLHCASRKCVFKIFMAHCLVKGLSLEDAWTMCHFIWYRSPHSTTVL